MMIWVLQFCFALLLANAGEWAMHRYLLHGLGKRRKSIWAYHLYEHHLISKKLDMVDPGYQKWPKFWNSQAKELFVLISILLVNAPFFLWANGYAWGMSFAVISYYLLHRKAHKDINWAKKYLPWHYRHHIGNSNTNWCVSYPLFDYLMGSYSK
ncbi:MAG: sterol desaturase family protein [Methyloprofundus sp.]|nr:sterol desaturase family protein [Methyloprofundus sp.]